LDNNEPRGRSEVLRFVFFLAPARMSNYAPNLRILFEIVVLAGMLALAPRIYAQPAVLVPEFTGGLRPGLVFQHAGFMNEARACAEKFPFSKYHVHTDRMQKDCIGQYMKEHGASAQAIAFMRFAPVPAAISEVKSYSVAAVVHADMMFADAADGWALIGKAGDVVPLWYGVELDRDPQFARFAAKHQGATLWGDSIDWPKASLLDGGAEQFGFAFEIKTCHACAILAHARVGYDFDRNGKFAGTHLLTIIPASPQH
jgi:hypothetical protein